MPLEENDHDQEQPPFYLAQCCFSIVTEDSSTTYLLSTVRLLQSSMDCLMVLQIRQYDGIGILISLV